MRRVLGVVALFLGSSVLLWIAYNLLIVRQPESKDHNPITAIIFGIVMCSVGLKWVRGEQAG
jgi:hypothetical protein